MNYDELPKVGYWADIDHPNLPNPIAGSSTLSDGDKIKVVRYLKQGRTLHRYKGFSLCRLCGRVNGSTDLTDDFYIWPDGLYHYIKAHDVKLPKEFIDHILIWTTLDEV